MRVTKISLATLLALGTMTCASAKTTLEEAIKGTTISGYVYGQLTSMFGDDASGTAFRSRFYSNINTGSIGGFSVGTRLYASMGAGAPNGGTFYANSGKGSSNGAPNGTMPVGMYALYGNMDFTEYGSKTTLMGGKLNIMTAFNATEWDYGYGIYVSNEDIEGVKFSAQAFGAWALDDNDYTNNTSIATEQPLYIVGVEAGGEKLAGASVKFYAGHATKLIDYMAAADVAYTIAGVTIQSQVAVMDVDANADRFALINGTGSTSNDLTANLRGLYNIQLAYTDKDIGFSAKGGFTGSFGDGYGALLNYASFNMGGQIWYDTVAGNGYGLTGAGGYKHLTYSGATTSANNTDIMVGYVGIAYTGVKSLKLGLDYAYVGGNNNYVLMAKGIDTQSKKAGSAVTKMNAELHEVSFTASYGFFDNKLTLSGLIGSTFGDLQMARARMKVQYSF